MKLILIYVVIGLIIAYILKHQLSVVNLLSTKTDLKSRQRISKKQKQLKLYIKLCPVWPLLLLKEIYDEIKERK
tara:strand:+ start:187 stop:408 length:222 start_codon:yes stop_codon:yes gene_type:complete